MKKTKKDYTCKYDSPLGTIMLASDGEALTGLWFEKQKYYAATLSTENEEKMLPIFQETIKWLDIYFAGKDPGFFPLLRLRASEFRNRVCEIMLTIPYGKTMTYGEIASMIAREKGIERMSAQAVGGAVGHNAISIIIPCHRVVGSNGSLTGYGGGIWRKVRLLELEHVDMSAFTVPEKGTAL